MLSVAPEVKAKQLSETLPQALALSDQLNLLSRELASTKAEIDKNEATIVSLRPWESFPADMATYQNSKKVKYYTGIIASSDVEKLEDLDATAEYQLFNEGMARTCVVACPQEEAKSVANFLKSLDWTDYAFPKISGTPAYAMNELAEKNRTLTARKIELEDELSRSATGKDTLVGRRIRRGSHRAGPRARRIGTHAFQRDIPAGRLAAR